MDGTATYVLKPLEDVSLADRAYHALREAILDLSLAPGEPLVEQRLAVALGISKTPIRQALHRLEQTGLVKGSSGRGYSVAPLTLRDAREILEIRAVLEGLATELACTRINDVTLESLHQLDQAAQQAYEAGQTERAVERGQRFHQTLIDAADNDRLVFLIGVLSDQYRRVRLLSNANIGRVPESIREHTEVLTAIEARDAVRAGQAMRSHLLAVYEDLHRAGTLPDN